MAKDNRIQMPSSGGGLVRYFDNYKSRFSFGPVTVIVMIVVVVILEILLHYLKPWG